MARPPEPPQLRASTDSIDLDPPSTGHRWADFIVAGSAILISCISLAVAVRNGQLTQQQVEASSWPLLQYSTGNANDQHQPNITMKIENVGVGPAVVKSIKVVYGGKVEKENVYFLKDCCNYHAKFGDAAHIEKGMLSSTKIIDTVIRPGDAETYLELEPTDDNHDAWVKLDAERFKVNVYACYCSVLGECWTADLSTTEKTPVKSCKKP
jgi:hypothetical protein